MARRHTTALVLIVMMGLSAVFVPVGPVSAQHDDGECSSETRPGIVVSAFALGSNRSILSAWLQTTDAGTASGRIAFSSGRDLMMSTSLVRVWTHEGDNPPKEEPPANGPRVNVRAVGILLMSREYVDVRFDSIDGGFGGGADWYRVRWRPVNADHEDQAIAAAEDSCGQGWTFDTGWVSTSGVRLSIAPR